MNLPDYFTGHDTYTRLSYGSAVVERPAGSVGDYIQTISGLGDLSLDDNQNSSSSVMYFLLTSLGSALAGGTVGYLSSGGNRASALVGAAVLGGLTGVADAGMFASEGKTDLALVTGFMSLASLVSAFYAFNDMRGTKSFGTYARR